VIGYDELTRNVLPRLAEFYDDVVVIDRTVAHIETLEAAGYDVIYGDFRHAEIRNAAGLNRADFVLSSSAEPDVNKALLAEVGESTTVFVEAEWTEDARELYGHGAHYVALSSQLTAERLAEYLDAYFEDRQTFTRLAETDVMNAQPSEAVPGLTEELDGGVGE
jgi:Trk K+ transport system NAD-binding subunit